MPVHTIFDDGIAVLTLDNPPVNALSARNGLVEDLLKKVHACLDDGNVKGVVLAGHGKLFSAGADIADFDSSPSSHAGDVRGLMSTIDAAGKPFVAAIHGLAFGGGFELALACHARICEAGTRLALPEVRLGLLPGGGGTQRTPRLAGVASALELISTGKAIEAAKALSLGLVDAVVNGDPIAAAVKKASELAATGVLPRASDRSPGTVEEHAETLAAARVKAAEGGATAMAQAAIVECVGAALRLPFAEGLLFEGDACDKLMVSDDSRALRHVFFMERKLGKLPGMPSPQDMVRRIGVIGGGTTGISIATAALEAGFEVVLVDKALSAAQHAARAIKGTPSGPIEIAARPLARFNSTTDLADVTAADLFIDTTSVDFDSKRQTLREIEKVARPEAILATNAFPLDIDKIANAVATPHRVVGLHLFVPADTMRLLEIVRASGTHPQVLSDMLAVTRKLGKVGVVSGTRNGSICTRIFEEYLRQACFLLEEGALPAQIDGAMERWGYAIGPLKLMDLIAHGTSHEVEKLDRPLSKLPEMIWETGRLGQKTGAGVYRYPESGGAAVIDPEIEAMIVAHSSALGIERRSISDGQIIERCLFSMINEGARLLDEGIATRPLDIDAVSIYGFGLSPARGGQMFQADRIGLDEVLHGIRRFQSGYHGSAWEPSSLLMRLVVENRLFSSLNG